MILLRVTAPHFVAGVEVGLDGFGVTAPILRRVTRGQTPLTFAEMCRRRGWRIEVIP